MKMKMFIMLFVFLLTGCSNHINGCGSPSNFIINQMQQDSSNKTI